MLYFNRNDVSTLVLIRQANQKNVMFVTIGTFDIKVLSFNQMSGMNAMIYKCL